jgi:serine/threonine protein kinase
MAGTTLIHGRFIPQASLGHDSFGETIAAIDKKTGKPVSLRVLANNQVGALVRQQVKALAGVQHPHLARSYGVVTGDTGSSYLVQSPLSGYRLGDFVAGRRKSGQPVAMGQALSVIEAVCDALTALGPTGPFAALRPSNVWLQDDGRVRVADVALTRAALLAAGPSAFPAEEQSFLAPEVKAGQAPTSASDVFGVGALFYTLLTGRSPAEAFVPPTQVRREVTSGLEAELFRAIAADPATRHANPDALKAAVLAQVAPAGASKGSTPSLDVDMSLTSMRPAGAIEIDVEFDADTFTEPSAVNPVAPGARIPLAQEFRPNVSADAQAVTAAAQRKSLGELDLKGVLAKITEDDAPRWMVVKNGMDHGPFSGRQIVAMIVQGEAAPDHELMNTDTGKRGKVSEFVEFKEFLAQVEIRQFEANRAQALVAADVKEKRGILFKVFVGGATLLCLSLAGGYYAYTRSHAQRAGAGDDGLDMYRRGDVEISGSAGILPIPKGGSRRSGSGGSSGGGPGGGMSYEDAMMQAVELGNIGGGGEQQLSAGTVAGVMNKHLNQLYGACVRGKLGHVRIDIAIAGSGQVQGVSVGAGDATFQRCIADQVRRIHFPSFGAPRMGARYSFDT